VKLLIIINWICFSTFIISRLDWAGENFVRYSGDTTRHAQAQLFAWEAQERGVDVHLLAEPTKLEVLKKEFTKKKEEFKGSLTKNIIDKYGGEEHLEAPPKSLLLAQTEDYVEYSRQGKIVKVGLCYIVHLSSV
jgi:pre-mRNA-processing factor SLU7